MTDARSSRAGRALARAIFPLAIAFVAACGAGSEAEPAPGPRTVAFAGARIYPSPSHAHIEDGIVLVADGVVTAVGRRGDHAVPDGAEVADCTGLTLTAGFWNSHVHFIDPQWMESASAPAALLSDRLARMLLRHGFTTVLDTGSSWPIAAALRRRILSGEVTGPRILTAGEILFPKGGAPRGAAFGDLGALVGAMPEIDTPASAEAAARKTLEKGADAVKLYVATWWNDPPVRLTQEAVRAAVEAAHRSGKPVLAHPSDARGIETALEGGVDVLVHTTPAGRSLWSPALVARMRELGVALVPTLKLWRVEVMREGVPEPTARAIQRVAVDQLRAYVEAGGEVLFGTDVGYMRDDDPREEYELMGAAGMDFRQVLASLTTAPARRFGDGRWTGTIAPGQPADFVLLDRGSARDPASLAEVVQVIRAGRVVYRQTAQGSGLEKQGGLRGRGLMD